MLTYFMKQWGEAWVRDHVHHIVAASGPFGGAVGSIKAPVSGDNLHLHFPHNLLHALQGVAPSGAWLFPSPALWKEDEVLVRTNKEHYSAHDLERLLAVRHHATRGVSRGSWRGCASAAPCMPLLETPHAHVRTFAKHGQLSIRKNSYA